MSIAYHSSVRFYHGNPRYFSRNHSTLRHPSYANLPAHRDPEFRHRFVDPKSFIHVYIFGVRDQV